jgi:hydrogenase nickel incorporation protein HypA/HybF
MASYAPAEVPAMHELSICSAIASTAAKHADGRSVSQVTVQIGHLRQVVPDALQFTWDVVSSSTNLKDAALPILSCGKCEGFDVKLLSGEELLVVSIDLMDV